MLLHINQAEQQTTVVKGVAHVVIGLLPDGTLRLQAFRGGVLDSFYMNCSDAGVLGSIPGLLAELRAAVAPAATENVAESRA